MGDILKYIEGRMDESELYGYIVLNVFKSFLILVGLIGISWVVYSFIIPAISGGKSGYFVAYLVVAIVAFWYVFKPKTLSEKTMWSLYAAAYAAVMYLAGECVIIAIILMGLFVALACAFGETTFTVLLTYRDLKQWVASDKKTVESKTNSSRASEILTDMTKSAPDDGKFS